MTRRLYLDRSAGEARGIVTLDGKPERLLIERDTDVPCQALGARMTARLARIDKTLNIGFLQLPEGRDAILALNPANNLVEGASIEIEISAEARRQKGAAARLIGASSGPARLIEPAPAIETRLKALAPANTPIETGPDARELADAAQDAAIAAVHPLPGGGSIAIESTRALIAIDVDLGMRKAQDPARAARAANLEAINEAARLLRLKGLAGLVVFDLAGKGHDGAAILTQAKRAFAPDGPSVNLGPISRFGLFELAVPHTAAPITERLFDDTGRPSAETQALILLRAMEREGRANPGARLAVAAAPDVTVAAKPFEAALSSRLGPRFLIRADLALSRETFHIEAR